MTGIETKTIDELTEKLIDYRGKTPRKTTSGIKLITAKVVKNGRILDDDHEYISPDEYEEWMRRGLPQKGDILITTEAPLGEVAMLRTSETVALAQRIILLRGNPTLIDQRFYFSALKSAFVQGQLAARATGTTVSGIKQSELRQVEIPWYPLSVQKQIADVLSEYDDLIENNIRRIQIIQEMAQVLYRQWFVQFKFPGNENCRFINSQIGQIPEGWAIKPLKDLCSQVDYGYTAQSAQEPIGPKFLRITDIVPSLIDWNTVPYCLIPENKRHKFVLADGDIVIARTGATVGYAKRIHTSVPDSVFASYLVRVRLKSEYDSYYVGLIVESDDYKRFINANMGGSAQPNANAQVLTSFPILVPPPHIRDSFSELIRPLLDQKIVLGTEARVLTQTRNLLLPMLITRNIDLADAFSKRPTPYRAEALV